MLHGYGGGAATFMRMAPLLKDYFTVIMVDLLGMGASGRPPGFDKTWELEKVISYFTDSLNVLISEKLKLKKIHLLGHSFGGYIAGEYALKYPTQLEHLILLSPVGMPELPDNYNLDVLKEHYSDSYFTKKGIETV
jgi:pimeloyl-ACP methyl ester carboxylesterase